MDATQTNTDTGLSFKPENFAADMAKLAAEQGISLTPAVEPVIPVVEVAPVETPTTPAQPETAAVTPEATKPEVVVPDKFKTPEGTIDEAKLEKSLFHAEETLAKYLEIEKQMKRKANEIKNSDSVNIYPAKTDNKTVVHQDNTEGKRVDAMIDEDLQRETPGKVIAKAMTTVYESVKDRVREEIAKIQSAQQEATSKAQIESIGKRDPWVYTEQGFNALSKVLADQPYLATAPDPYKAAYLFYKGMQNVVSTVPQQVLTPTPLARATAPVPSVHAAVKPEVNPEVMFDKLTPNQKAEFISKVPKAEQEKWFIRAGYPAFNSR